MKNLIPVTKSKQRQLLKQCKWFLILTPAQQLLVMIHPARKVLYKMLIPKNQNITHGSQQDILFEIICCKRWHPVINLFTQSITNLIIKSTDTEHSHLEKQVWPIIMNLKTSQSFLYLVRLEMLLLLVEQPKKLTSA